MSFPVLIWWSLTLLTAFEVYVEQRQIAALRRAAVPAKLHDLLDISAIGDLLDASVASARHTIVKRLYALALAYLDLKLGFVAIKWGWCQWAAAHLPNAGPCVASALYFCLSQAQQQFENIPINHYQVYVVDACPVFGTTLPMSRFLRDVVVSWAVTCACGAPVVALFVAIVTHFPRTYLVGLCLLLFVTIAVLQAVVPTVVLPLFNSFIPLEDSELKDQLSLLASSHRFPLSSIQVIDGSVRLAHLNAYFTGTPWNQHIVLFDTLLDLLPTNEVVAIAAHELGHWHLHHVTKILAWTQFQYTLLFVLFSRVVRLRSLYRLFGVDGMPPVVGYALFNRLATPLDHAFEFGANHLSRKHELEADEYAAKHGHAHSLHAALVTMHGANVPDPVMDPLYHAFRSSHPPLHQRLERLR